MLAHLVEVSVRSLILLGPAVLVRRRSAALQHAVATAVVCGMLALYGFGSFLPRLPVYLPGRTIAAATPGPAGDVEPVVFQSRPAPMRQNATDYEIRISWQAAVMFVYVAVAALLLGKLAMGMWLARRLRAGASLAFPHARDIYESERMAVPVAVGVLRPAIILPLEWRSWDDAKLDAVLAHEGAHVRRHDGLIAALASVNRSLLWFHPLAWWLERRLALLADQACDESSVAQLGDPHGYARLLLEMASVVDRSGGRLRPLALTMAAPSHMGRRIEALLEEGRTFSRGLSRMAVLWMALGAIPVLFAAGALQVDRRTIPAPYANALPLPPLFAAPRNPSVPVRIAQAITTPAPAAAPTVAVPKFDTASIKPCSAGDGAGHVGRGGAGGRGIPPSPPGQLFINCLSVAEMIDIARTHTNTILLNDFGGPMRPGRIRGGPAWVYTDYYTVNAESSDPSVTSLSQRESLSIASGPMLLALLGDRLRLNMHIGSEEVPSLSLTVATSGFRLQPAVAGSCKPYEPGMNVLFAAGNPAVCLSHTGWQGPNWTIDAAMQPLSRFARTLSGIITDRPVVDKTGIGGAYTFNLVFAHDANAPGAFAPGMRLPFEDGQPADSLPVVLERQLGLTLLPDRAQQEHIEIDNVERPSE